MNVTWKILSHPRESPLFFPFNTCVHICLGRSPRCLHVTFGAYEINTVPAVPQIQKRPLMSLCKHTHTHGFCIAGTSSFRRRPVIKLNSARSERDGWNIRVASIILFARCERRRSACIKGVRYTFFRRSRSGLADLVCIFIRRIAN